MASNASSHSNRISPRKFSEKIALLNKKEREANAKFEEIIKEVHATRGQQQPQVQLQQDQQSQAHPPPAQGDGGHCMQQVDNDLSGLTDLQAELQSLTDSANYKAAHADSLEEIEKVYENLLKSVGQYEDDEKQQSQQQLLMSSKQSALLHRSNGENARPTSRSSSAGLTKRTGTDCSLTDSNSTLIPSTTTAFYQRESSNANYLNNIDLNTNHQSINQGGNYGFYEQPSSSSSINNFSGHSTLEVRVSTSCIPQQQPPPPSQNLNYDTSGVVEPEPVCRARVVSFGSASRNRFPCPGAVPLTNTGSDVTSIQHNQCHQRSHQAIVANQYQNHPNQYLKEPAGDRSRQKSISDPELHMSPGQQRMIMNAVAPYKSDNRLACVEDENVPLFDPTLSGSFQLPTSNQIDCCIHQKQNHRSQQAANLNEDINNNNQSQVEYQSTQPGNDGANSREVMRHENILRHAVHCRDEQACRCGRHFRVCDTTTNGSRGQLPGIKICAIEDETNLSSRLMPVARQVAGPHSVCDPNSSNPSSRDGSLPDISNLRFGTNSTEASPERSQSYGRPNLPPGSSCRTIDENWNHQQNLNTLDMEMQIDSSLDATDYATQFVDTHLPHDDISNQATGASIRHHGGVFVQPTSRVNNNLSSSDCGFGASSAYHHQQGSLMICTSSDLYNNIMRSRSHNNISSMNGCGGVTSTGVGRVSGQKRPHIHTSSNLEQFEVQHHTSQYCLQADQQPMVNVRRIAELKAHGTSTSPLDSSSNLNSPQSEMNSPGSSTTEQCEPVLIFATNNQQHQHQHQQQQQQQHQQQQQQQQREYYTPEPLGIGSNSTLVPDGMHFHTPYESSNVTSCSSDGQQHQSMEQTSMFVDQADYVQTSEQASHYQQTSASVGPGVCLAQTQLECQQSVMTTAYHPSREVYKGTFVPSSNTTTNLNYNSNTATNNETGTQPR